MDSKEELEALGFKFVRRYGSEFYEWAYRYHQTT